MRENRVEQRLQRYFQDGSGIYYHFSETIKLPSRLPTVSLVFLFLIVGAFLSTRLLDSSALSRGSAPEPLLTAKTTRTISPEIPKIPPNVVEIPLDCAAFNLTRSCPANYPAAISENPDRPSLSTCPEYFRWIYEDLRPWASTGITRDMVERAKTTANFRLVIVKGKAYLEKYRRAFQTRDVFTLWGILQLLRKYPGKVPDLELMFDCVDWPVVKLSDYSGPNATAPPPLFRYCGDDDTLDIVFPDWSFWGWPEINIKPWGSLLNDLKEGNEKIKWMEREPYAYWKGNPAVATTRQDLMKCNVSNQQDWNARVYAQDWIRESQQGYKQSNLADQCNYRYKIYIEGSAWSVSEKYILACDSVALLVKPHYYDFFTRSLKPIDHYWPIKDDDKCRSIKFAVDWGNMHKQKAQAIGKVASEFIQQELKMEYVYDYMFHLLNQYANLLTFKPIIPRKAIELCSESMACLGLFNGVGKDFMMESMVKSPAETSPCTMLPPYDPPSLHAIFRRKELSVKQVESWQKKYWDNRSN